MPRLMLLFSVIATELAAFVDNKTKSSLLYVLWLDMIK
jgi:hypothetical protein